MREVDGSNLRMLQCEGKRFICYIDLGANVGVTLNKFIARAEIDLNKYNCFLFEPIDKKFNELTEMISKLNAKKHCHAYNVAAWDKDCLLEFGIGKKPNNTNSRIVEVFEDIQDHDRFKKRKVKAVDFSAWLRNKISNEKFKKYNYVILKMDIEGSEYRVIDKMCIDGTIKSIDRILIEYHNTIDHPDNIVSRLAYNEKITQCNPDIEIFVESGGCYNKIESNK